MNRKLLTKAIPIWSLLLVALMLGTITAMAVAQYPPIIETINEMRETKLKTVIVDATYGSVALDDDLDTATAIFTLDAEPETLTVTISLYSNLAGTTLIEGGSIEAVVTPEIGLTKTAVATYGLIDMTTVKCIIVDIGV